MLSAKIDGRVLDDISAIIIYQDGIPIGIVKKVDNAAMLLDSVRDQKEFLDTLRTLHEVPQTLHKFKGEIVGNK